MTPLELLSELLAQAPDRELHKWVRSLAAREEARVDSFWSDLAGPRLFGASGSVASLAWDDADAERAARRALFLIAEDLDLRGVASGESSAWLQAWRGASR